jgi:hypothetical protein
MSRKILIYLGRFLFVLVLITSVHHKILNHDKILVLYQKNYQYVQAGLRNYGILLPTTS